MRKEVSQGLGLVAIAALFALLWVVTGARFVGSVALLVAVGGLVLLAIGLLRPADQ